MRSGAVPSGLVTLAWLWILAVALLPALVFPVGHFLCHQRPERSFFQDGHQFAVCARCTGIYLGAAAGGAFALALAAPLEARRARLLLSVAALPVAITWSLEFAGLVAFSNVARFASGLPLGAAAAWLVLSILGRGASAP